MGEKERNINAWLPLTRPLLETWHATQGMFPDWELNQLLLRLLASTQSTEPHQPGLVVMILAWLCSLTYPHLAGYWLISAGPS